MNYLQLLLTGATAASIRCTTHTTPSAATATSTSSWRTSTNTAYKRIKGGKDNDSIYHSEPDQRGLGAAHFPRRLRIQHHLLPLVQHQDIAGELRVEQARSRSHQVRRFPARPVPALHQRYSPAAVRHYNRLARPGGIHRPVLRPRYHRSLPPGGLPLHQRSPYQTARHPKRPRQQRRRRKPGG